MSPRQQENLQLPVGEGGFLQGTLSHAGECGDRAVVYVHGLGSVRSGEKAQALEAACVRRGWTFAAFDFRGHGGSSGTMMDLRCATLLEDLEAASDYLAGRGVKQLLPVGSSMGGWATAWFALRHPDRVPACVLLAPSFDFPMGFWARLNEAQRLAWYQTGRLRLRNEWLDATVSYGLIEEAGAFPLEALVTEWRTPLLVFHGMRDDVIPYARSVTVAERMQYPGVEVRLLKDGDHRLTGFRDDLAEAACAFFERWGCQATRGS